jgi:ribosomal protein S18 acetylase RimI-like enzyme
VTPQIEPYDARHLEAVVRLSLRAWAPVFASLQQVFAPEVYHHLVPNWRVSQAKGVEAVCTDADMQVWVALDAGTPVGFVAVKLHTEDQVGEVYMLAVDPDVQGRGIGTALMTFALTWMADTGMAVAMVETGGDAGHAPARRTYEQLGFEVVPIARYYKKL